MFSGIACALPLQILSGNQPLNGNDLIFSTLIQELSLCPRIFTITSRKRCMILFSVGLSLSVMMFCLGMPGNTHLGPNHLWESPQKFPAWEESVLWLNRALWFLLWLQDAPQRKAIWELWKNKILLFAVLGWHTACSEPPKEVLGRDTVWTWVLPLLGLRVGCLRFYRFILYLVNLKPKGRNLGLEREKQGDSKGQESRLPGAV